MSDQEETTDGHLLRRWVSFGDVLVLLTTLAVFSFGYGRLSRDVEALSNSMAELQARDITPGARSQLAAIVATDTAMQQQITDIRGELRDQRREVVEAIARVEAKLDAHSERR